MDHDTPQSPEEIARILLRLEQGKATKGEILREYGISDTQLAQWQKDYLAAPALGGRAVTSRFGDVCLTLAVLTGLAMYVAHRYASELLDAQLRPLLVLVFSLAVVGLVLEDGRRGAVRVGRYRVVRREERPLVFWAIIAIEGLMAIIFASAVLMATG